MGTRWQRKILLFMRTITAREVEETRKHILASPPSLRALWTLERVLNRMSPRSRVLHRLLWVMCGLYIYNGFRMACDALVT
jgi:hypothetical protein